MHQRAENSPIIWMFLGEGGKASSKNAPIHRFEERHPRMHQRGEFTNLKKSLIQECTNKERIRQFEEGGDGRLF